MNRSRQLLTATGLVTALTLVGCKSNNAAQTANGQDPADANQAQPYTGGDAGGYSNAPATGQTRVLGQSQSYSPQASGESYETQTPAPIIRQAPAGTEYYPVPQAQGSQGASYSNDGQGYTDAEEAGEQALAETSQAPPPLPEYDQPPAPEDDYLWTPGYWNYASAGYYWVPGVWCAPPFYGALWTPPYWGFYGGHYLFHRGYWGPHVGYYGGVNYGFGYVGAGYFGGYWQGHNFYYNRAVTNVNVTNIHNVYNRTVVYNNVTYGPRPSNRVSYNGGPGGLRAQPTPQELGAMHEAHYAPVAAQRQNRVAASDNRAQFFADNHGRPAQAFAGHPLGAPSNIAAAPHEQPFNHLGTPAQPQPFANRAAAPNQPNNNHPTPFNRPGTPNQPNNNNNARPATGFNHPGEPQPENNRPANVNHPAAPQPNANRPEIFTRPAERPATPQPSPATAHPAAPSRPAATAPRPESEIQRPSQPQSRPQPEAQPAARPNPGFQRSEPAAPAPRPEARPAPQPEARPSAPAPHAAPAPRPAQAPHEAGGNHPH